MGSDPRLLYLFPVLEKRDWCHINFWSISPVCRQRSISPTPWQILRGCFLSGCPPNASPSPRQWLAGPGRLHGDMESAGTGVETEKRGKETHLCQCLGKNWSPFFSIVLRLSLYNVKHSIIYFKFREETALKFNCRFPSILVRLMN